MTVRYIGEVKRKGKNSLGVRAYTRTFLLETEFVIEGVMDVGSHLSLPVIGSLMPSDPSAVCKSLSIDNTNEWKGWTATAEYSTEVSPSQEEEDEKGNTTPRVSVSFNSTIYQEPAYFDNANEAILNKAGDFFADPPPTRDVGRLVAKISTSVTAVPAWILSYQSAINKNAITIGGLSIGAKLAKVQSLSVGEAQVRGFIKFYPVTIDIHIRKDGWNIQPLNAGFNQIVDNVVTPIKIGKDPITQPAPLDINGALIAVPTTTNAIFLNFDVDDELDFTSLPGVS